MEYWVQIGVHNFLCNLLAVYKKKTIYFLDFKNGDCLKVLMMNI